MLRLLKTFAAVYAAAQVAARHDDGVAVDAHADGALLVRVLLRLALYWLCIVLGACRLQLKTIDAFDLEGQSVDDERLLDEADFFEVLFPVVAAEHVVADKGDVFGVFVVVYRNHQGKVFMR